MCLVIPLLVHIIDVIAGNIKVTLHVACILSLPLDVKLKRYEEIVLDSLGCGIIQFSLALYCIMALQYCVLEYVPVPPVAILVTERAVLALQFIVVVVDVLYENLRMSLKSLHSSTVPCFMNGYIASVK